MNPSHPHLQHRDRRGRRHASLLLSAFLVSPVCLPAQTTATTSSDKVTADEVVTLSPFTVSANDDVGYRATSTLAGTRISTKLEDVGSSISVLTEEFLDDIGAVDNETALAYALGTEVGGARGNFTGVDAESDVDQNGIHETGSFANANSNTRIRGLARADNTRNLFRTDIPWDGYIVSRVDVQRGPNAMLFGLGSPAGVINASTNAASLYKRSGEVQLRNDQFGSVRLSADYNIPIIEKKLALRLATLRDRQQFRRDPAFENDDRYYGAFTFKPGFLNSDGKRLEFSGNFEHGDIESNRPRTIAPYDFISQFFAPVDEGGTGGGIVDLNTSAGRTNRGNIPNVGGLFDRGLEFSANAGLPFDFMVQGIANRGNRSSSGAIGNFPLWGFFTDTVPVDRTTWAAANPSLLTAEQQLLLEYSGLASKTIQDANVFDFYNLQFDGPNKREFLKWDTYDVDITNTYFHDKLGFNLAYHREEVDASRYAMFNENNNRIYIDMNASLLDVDVVSGQVTVTPNPNVGRAFVQHTLGGATSVDATERESARFSGFAEFDMRDHNDSWLGKLIGKHRINYVYEDQSSQVDHRVQRPGGFGPDFYAEALPGWNFSTFAALSNFKHYISDDVRGVSSFDQVRTTNVDTDLFAASLGPQTVRFFDTTWTAGDIYGQSWVDPDGTTRTQSQNPANYAGWKTKTYNFYNMSAPDVMVDGTDMTTMEYLTTAATATSEKIKSNVLVLQSYFWNDSIIGTWGYREDERDSYRLNAPTRTAPTDDTRPEVYGFGLDSGTVGYDEGSNTNWSVAVHLNRLLGKRDFLPFNVTVFYNKGENISPGGVSRVDVFENAIPRQTGETVDKSILLATKNGKFSLRITDFKTSFKNDSFGLGSTFLFQQSLSFPAQHLAEIRAGEYDLTNVPDLNRLMNTIIPAWEEFTHTLENDPRFAGFVNYQVDDGTLSNWILENPATNTPATTVNFRGQLTVDTVSTGQEFEFTANPTPNWRISINAAKTKAERDNAPGQAFQSVIDFIDNAMMNTPVGEMPFFADGSGFVRDETWIRYRGVFVPALALNGKSAPEIRKWRFNLISNYNFTDGRFKGVSVGGAWRYQAPQILGYGLERDEEGFIVPNLDDPYKGPSDSAIDLWVGYRRKLNANINWRVQLNVYNAFGENKAIPLNVDPDGTPNAVRVQEGTSWTLSNTFEF